MAVAPQKNAQTAMDGHVAKQPPSETANRRAGPIRGGWRI